MANETARYEYPDVLRSGGKTYRPTAVGRRRSDGGWEGWIEFVDAAGVKRVSTEVETTQSDANAFRYWATGIGVAYLEGALARALERHTRRQRCQRLCNDSTASPNPHSLGIPRPQSGREIVSA